MALPAFRAAGAKSAGTTAAVTVAAPTGVATGDLEVLIAETLDTTTVSITNNGGGAWTALSGSPISVANGERLYIWTRIRAGGDGDPQVTAAADHVCAARLAYQAGTFDTSDPFELETASSEAASDTSFSWAPGGTTGGADRLVLVVSSIRRDSNTASVPVCTNASLTALASRANYCTNSGLGGGFGVTEGAKATAGTVGTFACTYGAASPKSYLSFAIKPVGAANLFGAVSVAEAVAVTTVATRTTFAVAAVAETVAVATAGTVSKPGATSLELTAAIATSGRVDAKAAASSTSVVGITTVGKLTALGATTLTETVAVGTAATRTTFAASTTAETVTVGTAGAPTAKAAASLTETVATITTGTRDTFAATSLTETVTVTTAGDVTTGPQTHFGATSLSLTVAATTTGTVTARAAASLTAALTATTTGTRDARSSSSLTATVTITTAGDIAAGPATYMGATSLSLTVAIHTGTGAFPAGTVGGIIFAPRGQVVGPRTGRVVA